MTSSSEDKGTLTFFSDVVNEQVVLAAALADSETRARLVHKHPPDTFITPEHRVIWTVLGDMQKRHLEYDPATVVKLSGGAVDPGYLAQLTTARPDVPGNLAFHVDALLWDKAKHTALTGPIAALLEALRDPNESPERTQALGLQVAMSLRNYEERRHLHDSVELVRTQMSEIRQRLKGHAVYPYGLRGLDYYDAEHRGAKRMIPGAAPGQITVVTGTPGAGKSTTTARLILGLARQKRKVLVGAWEMRGGMTLELLAVISLGWSRSELIDPKVKGSARLKEGAEQFLTEERLVELEQRMVEISKYVSFMKLPRIPGKKRTNDDVLDMVQGYIADTGCDVAVFDLWKRCLVKTDPDEEEMALVRQQAMAEECKVHVILVQQQRLKDVEARPDKRPTREGIKGSGAWTEVADTILGIHRPALWRAMPDNTMEIDILKQRYGKWPLAVEFDWDPDTGSISGGTPVEYDAPSNNNSGGRSGASIEEKMATPKRAAGAR